jgi:hypothetical protein
MSLEGIRVTYTITLNEEGVDDHDDAAFALDSNASQRSSFSMSCASIIKVTRYG